MLNSHTEIALSLWVCRAIITTIMKVSVETKAPIITKQVPIMNTQNIIILILSNS